MVLIQQIRRLQTLIKFVDHIRLTNVGVTKSYSVYSPIYKQPIFLKREQAALKDTGEAEKLAHVPIRPALINHTSSDFYDVTVQKFTNHIMREGNKEFARSLLEKAFELVKRIQLTRYHKAKPENHSSIILDPVEVLYKAIDNVKPDMELCPMKRGGGTYQVPVPITPKRQTFLGMTWLVKAAKDKKYRKWPTPNLLANELIDASNNQGRVVKKKQELHRQCEENRAYAHYRWL